MSIVKSFCTAVGLLASIMHPQNAFSQTFSKKAAGKVIEHILVKEGTKFLIEDASTINDAHCFPSLFDEINVSTKDSILIRQQALKYTGYKWKHSINPRVSITSYDSLNRAYKRQVENLKAGIHTGKLIQSDYIALS